MSDWIVIPCLKALQKEFDEVNPNRDKGAEGFVGDSSHTSTSDHTPDEDSDNLKNKDSDHVNEVHAYDCDSTGPWPDGQRGDIKGSWFDKKIHQIVADEKKRWNDPNDMCRLNYIIWFGEIFDKDNNWAPKPYTGSDPHTNHAHCSARYETRAENDTSSWHVSEDEMLNDADKPKFFSWLDEYFDKYTQDANGWRQSPVGRAVWNNQSVPNPHNGENQKSAAYDLSRDSAEVLIDIKTGLDSALEILEAGDEPPNA